MTVRQRLGSSWNTTTGTHTVTATPVVGDLIVIICANTGTTVVPTVSDNNADGLGAYTRIVTSLKATSADAMFIFIRNAFIGSATSTVFSVTGASSTGGGCTVWAVTGVNQTGASAARQSAHQDNQAAGTPAPTFAAAVLTTNILLAGIFNATNPATMTPPTNYTEEIDTGYATPTTGVEFVKRNSGETNTTITWGSASASAFGDVIVELDTAVHGALAQTLGAVTDSSAAQVIIKGALAQTLGAVTLSATGHVPGTSISGTLAVTLGSVLLADAGKVLVKGALAQTFGAITEASAGKVATHGALAITLGSISKSIAGGVQVKGVLSITLGAVTLSATGGAAAAVHGALAITLGAILESSAGTVQVKGALAQTLTALLEASSGKVITHGALAQTLGSISEASAGAVLNRGALSRTLGPLADSSAGKVIIRGALAQSVAAVTLVANGVGAGLHGALSVTLGLVIGQAWGLVKTVPPFSIAGSDVLVNTVLVQERSINASQAQEREVNAIEMQERSINAAAGSELLFNTVRSSMEYPTGNIVRLIGKFTDYNNAYIDPTSVLLSVTTPAGVTTVYTYGASAIVKDSVGNYHFDIDTTGVKGTYYYLWSCTGTGQSADFQRRFVVE